MGTLHGDIRGALSLMKFLNSAAGQLESITQIRWKLSPCLLKTTGGNRNRLRPKAIEAFGELLNRGVASAADILQDLIDPFASIALLIAGGPRRQTP
jgi:hypothetical protein